MAVTILFEATIKEKINNISWNKGEFIENSLFNFVDIFPIIYILPKARVINVSGSAYFI